MRTLQSELVEKGFTKEENLRGQTKPTKRKEQFSRREIEELMGVRRAKYHRVKGSFRSR